MVRFFLMWQELKKADGNKQSLILLRTKLIVAYALICRDLRDQAWMNGRFDLYMGWTKVHLLMTQADQTKKI